jgi:hypothetical protein
MQSTSRGLRVTLLAGVSVVALAAASPNASAADMASPPVLRKAPPPPPPKSTWAWWIEGGAVNPAGSTPNFGPVTVLGTTMNTGLGGPRPNWGFEGAVGFDWQNADMGPWHLSGQFRYGSAQKSQALNKSITGVVSTTTVFAASVSGNSKIKDDHWLVDFNVGRDFGLGNNAQWTLGVRVADLRSTLNLNGKFAVAAAGVSTTAGVFNAQAKSTFLGAGPRLGVVGETPLGGGWSFDWLAGAAVLFGERQVQRTAADTTATGSVGSITSTNSDNAAVFNLDAQAGISYWVNPNVKITASYRFDGYFNAIREFDASGNLVDANRYYQGPMLRLTSKF